ncbi:MAG: hypothetical protein WCC26_07685 [Terracidiphilus sp.]
MGRWFGQAGKRWRAGMGLAVVTLWVAMPAPALAGLLSRKHPKAVTADADQNKGESTSQPPAASIPVEPLGFFAPGAFYMGLRESLVSLDFLDEERLLFTFRTPGLIRRKNAADDGERQIRAEVLRLPQGSVESEALWTLHDHDRYLWMLRDGHFLLRDQEVVKEGDARLGLRSLLQFPGPILSMAVDPAQRFLVTNSLEPSDHKPQAGDVGSPAAAEANVSNESSGSFGQKDIVVRILERASGRVMLVSRVHTTVRLPINTEGYIETLRGTGQQWILNFDDFTGGSKILAKVDSSCQPPIDFVSQDEAVANTCSVDTGRRLVALSMEGEQLWQAPSPPTQVWPLLVMAPNGSRLARETLTLDHAMDGFAHPLDPQDIKGQVVEVFDAVGGMRVLKVSASPVLDGGGNVAISPSGKRVAVLNAGAIQVYDLPPPQVSTLGTKPAH